MENNLIGYFRIGNEIYTAISEEEGTGVLMILKILMKLILQLPGIRNN